MKHLHLYTSLLLATCLATPAHAAENAAQVFEQAEKKTIGVIPAVQAYPQAQAAISSPTGIEPAAGEEGVRTEKAAENLEKLVEPAAPLPDVSNQPVVTSAPRSEPPPAPPVEKNQKIAANDQAEKSPPPMAPVKKVRVPIKDVAQDVINALVIDQQGTGQGELSLIAALDEAYRTNPTLRAARADVQTVYESLPQAMANWRPDVTASASATHTSSDTDPGGNTSGTEKSAGVSVTQPLYRGGRTLAETRVAQSRIDAQLASLANAERQVFYSSAVAYMDVLRDQALVRVNEKNRDVIARQLKATEDRFRVGDVTRTDVAQAEFRLARAEADKAAAEGALQTSRAVFQQLIGRMPEGLSLPGIAFDVPATQDSAVTFAETYNPGVIAALALHRAAIETVGSVAGGLLPEISLSGGIEKSMDPVSSTQSIDDRETVSVGVTASMPLYQGGAVQSRVREAKYGVRQREMRILEAKRAAREETVRAWEGLNAARAELTSRAAQLKAATVARDGVHQEAEVGTRTILDALDSDQELRDAQAALITAKRNEIVAQFALASALGLLTPGAVGIENPVFDYDAYANGWTGRILSWSTGIDDESGR